MTRSRLSRVATGAKQRGGTVVHVIAGAPPRVRQAGELKEMEGEAGWSGAEMEGLLSEMLTERELATLRRDGEGEYRVELEPGWTVNVAVFRALEGWRVVVHLV